MLLKRLYAAAAALMAVAGAHAQSQFEQDFDDKDKPWQEVEVQLPAAPKADNLVSFYVSPTTTQHFAIDVSSISLGSDGVVRYTLVATSSTGARNVSYEGIRCQTFERKLYAFGRDDGHWSRSRRDQWERIYDNAVNRQQAALAQDFFCQETMVAGKAEDMVARLRNKKSMSPLHYP